jgi:hypothetical protein
MNNLFLLSRGNFAKQQQKEIKQKDKILRLLSQENSGFQPQSSKSNYEQRSSFAQNSKEMKQKQQTQ